MALCVQKNSINLNTTTAKILYNGNRTEPFYVIEKTSKQRQKIPSPTPKTMAKIKKQVGFSLEEKTYTQKRREAIKEALKSCGADVTKEDFIEKFIELYVYYGFRVNPVVDGVRIDSVTGKAVPFSNKKFAEGHYFGYDPTEGDMAKVESEMRHDLLHGMKFRPSNLPPLADPLKLPKRIYYEAIILPPYGNKSPI